MERIASFSVDHTCLPAGIYLSREDTTPSGDTIRSYDIRMTSPNQEPVLSTASIHTLEHLWATYLRNHTIWWPRTVYFGPMGCRTGMYALFSGEYSELNLVTVIQELYQWISELPDEYAVPGVSAAECGNWRDHDFFTARNNALHYLSVIKEKKQLDTYTFL